MTEGNWGIGGDWEQRPYADNKGINNGYNKFHSATIW